LRKRNSTEENELIIVEFKVPCELMQKFDKKIQNEYSSRSEALRALIRKFLEKRGINKL